MPAQRGAEERFMREAVELSREGMRARRGGPFGAVIVRGGEIVARGCNEVTSSGDPTAHAEMVAIRAAARALENFSLEGCEIYTSCEPCPMCLAAIYWARLDRVFFACARADAAAAGFDDDRLYKEIPLPVAERSLPMTTLLSTEGQAVMREWNAMPDKVPY